MLGGSLSEGGEGGAGVISHHCHAIPEAAVRTMKCLRYSYTTSCCGLSGIHEAVIQLEAEAQPRLLIE